MSKLIIEYLNNQTIKQDVTGFDISVTNDFIQIKKAEDRMSYIPLCNIKQLTIEGHNKVIQ